MEGTSNVLVTGGAGYVGSHACKALAAAGYRPVCYDSLIRGHRELVRWGPLEEGDLLDAARLDEVFARYRPASVMHFAAFAYVGESVSDPALYFRNNVQGSLTLLDAMRRHGVDRFVFSSTCAVYGIPEVVPIAETEKRRPINPYGTSKLMVEMMLEDFHRAFGLRYVALRYFNAAGADPDGEIGECHDPETHLIPLVLDAAAGRRPHVEIYGEDYDTPDGTCIRDYIHVTDLAAAHVLALKYLDRDGAGGAFNLGNAAGTSVREVIALAGEITGREVPVRHAPRREGDPPRLVADSSRIVRELGWRPAHSDIRDIVATAWAWHQKRSC